jgi:hypothetical protein
VRQKERKRASYESEKTFQEKKKTNKQHDTSNQIITSKTKRSKEQRKAFETNQKNQKVSPHRFIPTPFEVSLNRLLHAVRTGRVALSSETTENSEMKKRQY